MSITDLEELAELAHTDVELARSIKELVDAGADIGRGKINFLAAPNAVDRFSFELSEDVLALLAAARARKFERDKLGV